MNVVASLSQNDQTNKFKQALAAGRSRIGLWNSLASAVTVKIVAGAGFDWVLVDMENAPNDLPLVHAQLQATIAYPDTAPVVRPPSNDMVTIKRLLDLGGPASPSKQDPVAALTLGLVQRRVRTLQGRQPPG